MSLSKSEACVKIISNWYLNYISKCNLYFVISLQFLEQLGNVIKMRFLKETVSWLIVNSTTSKK